MPRYYQQPQDESQQNLAQLLQLAQFAHLTSDTAQDQQRLEQQDQEHRVASAIALLGLQQQKDVAAQTAKNEDAQRELQRLGIEEVAKSREATTKSNVADALLTLGTHNPDSLPLVSGALEKLGYPELAGSAKDLHLQNSKVKAATLLPAIMAAHQKGGDVYKNALTMAQADPDVWDAIKPHLPAEVPATPASSLGTKLGGIARLTNQLDPVSLFSNLVKTGYNVGKKEGPDFWNALLDKKQPQPAQ